MADDSTAPMIPVGTPPRSAFRRCLFHARTYTGKCPECYPKDAPKQALRLHVRAGTFAGQPVNLYFVTKRGQDIRAAFDERAAHHAVPQWLPSSRDAIGAYGATFHSQW